MFPENISQKHRINLIKGVSQSGKSNFACNLALMLRRKPFQYAVMYIGNMEHFNTSPIEHCAKELFYWFHAQILMGYALNPVFQNMEIRLELLGYIMEFLVSICKQKNKTIYFIEDQFNNLGADKVKEVEEILKKLSDFRILVSTNTDKNALQVARPDAGNAFTFELDERKNPIKEPGLKNIIA